MPRKPFRCPIDSCHAPAVSRVAVAQHLYDVHREPEPLTLLQEWTKLSHYQCPIDGCPEARFDAKSYQKHLAGHSAAELTPASTALKPYMCSKGCQAIIVAADARRRHQSQCSGSPGIILTDATASTSEPSTAVVSAAPAPSFRCQDCGHVFTSRLVLGRHYRDTPCEAVSGTALHQVGNDCCIGCIGSEITQSALSYCR